MMKSIAVKTASSRRLLASSILKRVVKFLYLSIEMTVPISRDKTDPLFAKMNNCSSDFTTLTLR